MRARHFTVVVLLALVWAAGPANTHLAAAPPAPSINLPCVVVGVVDGDTLDVDVTIRVRIRLLACYCPEKKEPGYKSATDSLRLAVASPGGALTYGILEVPLKSNRLKDILTLNRVLGFVWVDGKSLSESQVGLGVASSTKGGELGK